MESSISKLFDSGLQNTHIRLKTVRETIQW